jgi:hypothetical protein
MRLRRVRTRGRTPVCIFGSLNLLIYVLNQMLYDGIVLGDGAKRPQRIDASGSLQTSNGVVLIS